MVKTIIPVGTSLGPYFNENRELECCEVQLGMETVEVTDEEWAVWRISHHNAELHSQRKYGIDSLVKDVQSENDHLNRLEIKRHFFRLKELNLLIQFDYEADSVESFLRSFKMAPTAVSWGNLPDSPDKFRIGPDQENYIEISGLNRGVWILAHKFVSIWGACEKIAEMANTADVKAIATDFMSDIPLMISMQCGHLEPAK
ncbi:hypothetical protein [Haloglycomyces albus]|uniref:hypothetical protein n=1 Tax=Haloglycomyces albus TaxID=526067 RepID=UPI00046CF4A1|nr:hypothetical protein [Haloglycomyces albus]